MMKRGISLSILPFVSTILFSKNIALSGDSPVWNKLSGNGYTVYYTAADKDAVKKINAYLQSGIDHITWFFDHEFQDSFSVYIFPDRSALDKQWQMNWSDSTFRSDCCMVASGVARRLDILSPNAWAGEACDHDANDSAESRQIIWHELVHVFHGQHNPHHTFSFKKLDWLVEGLATYVSGQLDEKRYQLVREIVIAKIPGIVR